MRSSRLGALQTFPRTGGPFFVRVPWSGPLVMPTPFGTAAEAPACKGLWNACHAVLFHLLRTFRRFRLPHPSPPVAAFPGVDLRWQWRLNTFRTQHRLAGKFTARRSTVERWKRCIRWRPVSGCWRLCLARSVKGERSGAKC